MSIYLITLLNVVNGMSLRGSRVLLSLFAIHLGAGAFEIGILISVSSVLQNPGILTLVAFLLGLSLGCGQPLSMILTYNRSPDGRAGETLGLRITVNKVIQIGVPLVFGSIGSAFGLIPVFWCNAVLLVTGGYLNQKPDKDVGG